MSFNYVDTRLQWQLAPKLVFTPTLLDFGQLARNGKETRELYVTNLHGPIDQCTITPSAENSWFRLLSVHGMSGYERGCIRIVIEVDTDALVAGEQYHGWLEASIEQVSTRVPLVAEVNAERRSLVKRGHLPPRLDKTLLTAIVLGGITLLCLVQGTVLADKILPALLAQQRQAAREQLAFAVDDGTTLTLQSTDMSAIHHENLGVAGWSPAWSPDSTTLAFFSDRSGAPQLYLREAAADAPIQLTNSPAAKSALAWSPDGSKLAFLAGPADRAVVQIVDRHRAARGSTAPEFAHDDRLTTMVTNLFQQQNSPEQTRGYTTRFAWSPDGQALLLDYHQADAVNVLHTSAVGVAVVAEDSWSPAWSPDGKSIAAVSRAGLFRATLTGQHRQLLSHRQAQAPAWSPDGRQIAFLARPEAENGPMRKGFDLWLIDEWGAHETLLTGGCVAFAWSPDGKQLAYVTGEEQSAAPLLYLWTRKAEAKPLLLAEVSNPTIAWKPLP